ncbi:hypothetical protein Axy04_017 [Achromobacter phage vB_AxyP_19-32_Axy04]|uniref:Uncharacterized protein n=1 Tax=Achromobacter phage vB_AxyP_19-32_Axy04 TaxID=2591039 RepID=A0A514CTJ0_9CAUD|nr:hypothetical protein KMC55_gp17 [Achromobacter phage vB_AxyP_19-32_Axy04]QDH83792.1 hypothetical protein Axy04_017 [Achromobacter phage vB_AxyP_19-32_Axy04]
MTVIRTDEEVKQILRDHVLLCGGYAVAQILADVMQESSDEMKKHGNMGAIIHLDCAAQQEAVKTMKYGHPLRY